MKGYNFFGRCAIATNWDSAIKWVIVALVAALPLSIAATPVNDNVLDVESFTGAVVNWIEGVDGRDVDAYDPQIFTEISPILDSPQGVRLPEDQVPAE